MKLDTIHAMFLAAILAPTAAAQNKLGPRAFFPSDYSSGAFVDLRGMRDVGLWDAIQRAPFARMLFGEFDQTYGFGLDDVDELRVAFVFDGRPRHGPQQVFVYEGNENVVLPAEVEPPPGRRVEELEIGGHTALRRSYDFEGGPVDLLVSPKDGVVVYGTEELVAPVLKGERSGGVPTPDLLSLTTRPGMLAYMAVTLNDRMRSDLPPFMSENWITEDDPLSHMTVRIRRNGTGDETTIALEAVLRCEKGDKGPAVIEEHVEAGLVELREHRRLGALKRFWEKVEVERDGRDVTLTLDLGSPREASGALPLLIAPMFITSGAEPVEVPAAEPVAPPVSVEAEPDRKKEKEKGKGKGKQ